MRMKDDSSEFERAMVMFEGISDPTPKTRPCLSNLNVRLEKNPVWSSAAADAVLCTSVVTIGYLRYCLLFSQLKPV